MITTAKARKILPTGTFLDVCENTPHVEEVCFSYIGEAIPQHPHEQVLREAKPVAYLYPIRSINTDSGRFQNRTDHYSEAIAQAVAENYNPNKFDPIVVWFDNIAGKVFVLSGHSRLEGMKRRKETHIPARFFEGKEAEAIQFARVEANRAATKESLTEDLKAYNLMRLGDMTKGIAPATPAAIKEAFRGKEKTLEILAYLNPAGKFIEILSNEDIISQFPRIQMFAKWTGILRKKYGTRLTNRHEADIFNWIYGDPTHQRIKRENFDELIRKRLELGKERLFPECPEGEPCKDIKNFEELPPNGHLYKQLSEIGKDLEIITDRLKNQNVRDATRVQTEEERQALRTLHERLQKKFSQLQRDIGIVEKYQDAQALFGVEQEATYIVYFGTGKTKQRVFSTARTATEARQEARQHAGKKAKITKIIKI